MKQGNGAELPFPCFFEGIGGFPVDEKLPGRNPNLCR